VNDARVLDKEKRNPRWGENEHFKMYMLIPEEWNGWAGFCYTLFFIFCCFEMGPAKWAFPDDSHLRRRER
jgi:hypothetical protein